MSKINHVALKSCEKSITFVHSPTQINGFLIPPGNLSDGQKLVGVQKCEIPPKTYIVRNAERLEQKKFSVLVCSVLSSEL